MTTYLVSFLLAFLAALALTPLLIVAANRWGVVDGAGLSHRKLHAADMPRLGGLAIVVAFYAPLAALTVYQTRVGDAVWTDPRLPQALVVGGLGIAALGLWDDLHGTTPAVKLSVQLVVALLVAQLGLGITRIDLPFLPMADLGWLGVPLTVLWIVGLTNAVNLIDGLDGLAAGVALFGLFPMVVLAVSKGNLVLALVCCCLAGAVLGFLVFNFHPARIFMGDTGSMFLGYVLAVVSISTAYKGRLAVAMLTPILALGLPILDTLVSLARRAWLGQSLFVGDRQHIHHRLLATGLSHRNTVLVLYGVAATFAALGLGVHFNRDRESALLFLLSVVVAGVLLRKVGYLASPAVELAHSAAIRERNLLVRDAWARVDQQDRAGRPTDDLLAGIEQIAFAAGAATARLELPDPAAPVRAWTWGPPPERVREVAFALVDLQGRQHGTVHVGWPDDATFHDAVLPRVEAAVRKLAERLPSDGP